ILTANWEAQAGQQWTVPVGGGGGKIVHLGRLPLNLSLAAFYNVETPQYGSTWQLRFTVQMLFPR
ncbi:MAG: neuromedin U, partial [Verrucomicrobiota bacterium]